MIKEGIIDYAKVYKQKGDKIGGEITSSNRVGVFVAKSESKESLNKKVSLAFGNLTILDINQNDMKRDI